MCGKLNFDVSEVINYLLLMSSLFSLNITFLEKSASYEEPHPMHAQQMDDSYPKPSLLMPPIHIPLNNFSLLFQVSIILHSLTHIVEQYEPGFICIDNEAFIIKLILDWVHIFNMLNNSFILCDISFRNRLCACHIGLF